MTSPSPNRRSFLKGTVAAAVGLVAAPLRRALPAPIPEPVPVVPPAAAAATPGPYGWLEVFSEGGTRLASFAIPEAPRVAMDGGKASIVFPPIPTATAEATGVPRTVRLTRATVDGPEFLMSFGAGVGEGEFDFGSSITAGGTTGIHAFTVGHHQGTDALAAETAAWFDDVDPWFGYYD